MGCWTPQNSSLRLKNGLFQMSGLKKGSSDISKLCSEDSLWAFSDVRTKKYFLGYLKIVF